MGILPAAPKVEVFAPSALVVGEPAMIRVEVTAADETKIDFIDVKARGRQGWEVGSGKSSVSMRAVFPELVARVHDGGVLAAGTSRFTAQFTLPRGTAPSHAAAPAWATFQIVVHVSIPWWPDGRSRFVLPVRLPAPPVVTRTPLAMRSTPAGAPADKPRLELALASTRLIAGETVVGSCAVFHLDDRKPREVELQIVPVLRLHGRGRVRERRGRGYELQITLPAGSAGTSVPFQFALPAAITPTFTSVTHELAWLLIASSGSFFGGKVEMAVPLEIVDASAAATTERLRVAPRLADERTTAVFAGFAEHHGYALADDDDDRAGPPRIVRAEGDAELQIAHAYRGEDGTFLVTRVTYPSLGLDLDVRPGSTLRHVFFRDIEIAAADWDRNHLVAARSREQVVPVLRALVPAVQHAMRTLGPLVRWDDDTLELERPITNVESAALASAHAALVDLAAALAAARATIAPPHGVADVDAWRDLARDLRGALVIGDLSLDGSLDGAPVDLALTWDTAGAPNGIRAHVGDPSLASGAARAIAFSLAAPARDALASPAPEGAIAQLVAWPVDIVDLAVTDGVVSAARPTTDAASARELVRALRALLAVLDPGAGPYR